MEHPLKQQPSNSASTAFQPAASPPAAYASAPALGVYISVPFCKAKCSYCNFASGVFAAGRMRAYVERVCAEVRSARNHATAVQAYMPSRVDSVYFGGGTPSLLAPQQLRQMFTTLRAEFELAPDAEITMECAPGQIADDVLAEFCALGVNRVSFGVQSFVDAESRAVGRLHTREQCLAEVERVRNAGIDEINVDLIVGLPHQTAASWQQSLEQAAASAVPHVSVYMLEVDEDSRLGSELLAGGVRYHAHHVPDEDLVADLYVAACEFLEGAGVAQYEISNFARPGHAARHNLKYWQRAPYLGLGMDAHSMLLTGQTAAVRFANVDELDTYMAAAEPMAAQVIDADAALEEALFLGLRMNAGVNLDLLREGFGATRVGRCLPAMRELAVEGLLQLDNADVKLTARGRLLSNEVFGRLLEGVPA